ncbi:MAG: hypothetical protein WC981_03780, partial [Candidatus Dojkabacteria bacterium]
MPTNTYPSFYQHIVTAGETTFTAPYIDSAVSELEVRVNGVVLDPANYSYNPSIPSVTITSALTTGDIVVVERVVDIERAVAYHDLNYLTANALNTDSNQLLLLAQRGMQEAIQNAL